MGEKWDFKRRIKFLITLSVSVSLFLTTVLLVLFAVLFMDKHRSNHVRSEITTSEIIKKNYIKGFENTSEKGEFTFRFREDEINDMLKDGVATLNVKHIANIYYERTQNNIHVFYVDLNKTYVKTRVVINTEVGDITSDSVSLNIKSVKMGKVNAYGMLIRKGYLTEDFINKYFEACKLPFSFSKSENAFKVSASKYISTFPIGNISSLLWDQVEQTPSSYYINPVNLGLVVEFSKIRTNESIAIKSFSNPIPNYYQTLKDELEAIDLGSMSLGDKATALSLTEDDFDQLLSESLPATEKEEVTSSIISSKATFELVGTNTEFKENNIIDVGYLYSVNGYLVEAHQDIELIDNSVDYYNALLEAKYKVKFGKNNYEGADNKFVAHLTSTLGHIFENIQEKQPNFFNFSLSQDSMFIDLQDMNNAHSSSTLRDSSKSVELDLSTKTLNFILEKSVM